MLKRVAFILILLCLRVFLAFGEVTKDDIAGAIDIRSFKHPYLYFTDEEKPAILERIKNDPETRHAWRKIFAECNRHLYVPVEPAPIFQEDPLKFHLADGRYYDYAEWAVDLAFVYQMTGEKKYADKAFEMADTVCDIPTWTYQYHRFPIIYNRVWPWNCKDDQVVFSADMESAEKAFFFAAVYDWLYPALTKQQRDRIRGALLEKHILPVRGGWDYFWWTSAYRCNWAFHGMNGLGVASLALLTEDPQLTDVIAECYNRLGKALNEIGVDGGWLEGNQYWLGVMLANPFFDALKRLTDGKYNHFEHPRFKTKGTAFPLYFYIPHSSQVDFCDGHFHINHEGYSPYSGLISKYIDETGNREAATYFNFFYGEADDEWDIIWPRSSVKPAFPEEASIHFRTYDWVVMRSSFTDTGSVVVACKAGRNDDPHHGHLDVGQFALYWRGQGYISDLGAMQYDVPYFWENRWEYPHASSAGHNVVFVNGELQIPAKRKNQPWNSEVGGKILEFRCGTDRDYTLMDCTDAYMKKELKGWRRHIILEKPVITVVLDEVQSRTGTEIETRFHSQCDFEIMNTHVLLRGEKGMMALIPVVKGDFSLQPGKHASWSGRSEARLEMIPYFGTVINAKDTDSVIATIILPVADNREARDIAGSIKRTVDSAGNLRLSFVKDGKTYAYKFKKSKAGLVLE